MTSTVPPDARVAVVTRTRNRPLFLPRARESVVGQTFRDFVWVIVNDGGAPEIPEREAERARGEGVRTLIVHRPESVGMEAASNDGIRRVDSEYVVVHDDDDSWEPGFLADAVAVLDRMPDRLGVVCYSTKVIEELRGDDIVELRREPYNDKLRAIYLSDLCEMNRFPPISFLFRRSIFEAVGGFDESLPVLGDWDFNLKVLIQGEVALLPAFLANYHWRLEASPGREAYGNTVTTWLARHAETDCRYRNQKLRQDLVTGRPGLGFLLAMGRTLAHSTARTGQALDALSERREPS